jgi:hypothetical protein
VNKKQNVEIDSHATSGGQGKYMKYVIVTWPPLEAALLTLNVVCFLKKKTIFE